MKFLVNEEIIIKYLRGGEVLERKSLEKFWKTLNEDSSDIFYLTHLGFLKICDFIENWTNENETANQIIERIESLFQIISREKSHHILHSSRDYEGIVTGYEIESVLQLELDAILALRPFHYHCEKRESIDILSLEQYFEKIESSKELERKRQELEEALKAPFDYFVEEAVQLSLQGLESKYITHYKVRNTISIVIDAFSILKDSGCSGMTLQSFQQKLQKKTRTISSIISDLEHFDMAYFSRSNSMLYVNQRLLDTGKKDIAQYISNTLKKNIVVQKIEMYVQENKCISSPAVEDIIKKVFAHQNLSPKTRKDYCCRFLSWLKFAEILEKRQKYFYYAYSSDGVNSLESRVYEQLALPIALIN